MKIKKGEHEKLARAFFQGAREALEFYSHLHGGIKYVSYGKTLQQALDEIDKEEAASLLALKENSEEQGRKGGEK